MSLRASLALLAAVAPLPAGAQPTNEPRQQVRQVVVFGNDPCPQSTADEVVVCARRPETERYRLRDRTSPPSPTDRRSALQRDQELREVSATGIDSCSPVGPGGQTGCLQQQINRSRVGIDGEEEGTATDDPD
jgi:hypothetical protein